MSKKALPVIFSAVAVCVIIAWMTHENRRVYADTGISQISGKAASERDDMLPPEVNGQKIRIRKCEANLDHKVLTENKYDVLDSPEKVFHEYFVAINTADWDGFEKLTVNFNDYCKRAKTTYAERKELLLNAWRADSETKTTFSLNYFVECQGRYFLVMHSRYLRNGKYKGGPRPLPLVKKEGLYYFDANGFDANDPIVHALLFTPFSEYEKALKK
ncbi:MAG: hypothetical protein HPZ91_11420 [Lentisphaeria bacterium]|nr:hypothetical protein [Lentisphaeria bacterium]